MEHVHSVGDLNPVDRHLLAKIHELEERLIALEARPTVARYDGRASNLGAPNFNPFIGPAVTCETVLLPVEDCGG